MAEHALTGQQRRAAGLVAQSHQQKDAAEEVGVSAKTLGRWAKRDDFRALVHQQRGDLVEETPTAEAVLAAALSATKTSGEPDWTARIMAARALMGSLVAAPRPSSRRGRPCAKRGSTSPPRARTMARPTLRDVERRSTRSTRRAVRSWSTPTGDCLPPAIRCPAVRNPDRPR